MSTLRESVSMTSRKVGDFVFDAVTAEVHNSTLQVTQNPIEGDENNPASFISDHAVIAPTEITVNGVMVSYQPVRGLLNYLPDEFDLIREVPLPVNVHALTNQALSMGSRYLSQGVYAVERLNKVVAPFLPQVRGGADSSYTMDRVQKALNEFKGMQRRAELLEVQTGVALYKDMALKNVSMTQTDDGSAEFSLTFGEVHIVNLVKVGGLKVVSAGRANVQSAQVNDRGRTKPESVLHWNLGEVSFGL